jgi:hypothetical protein
MRNYCICCGSRLAAPVDVPHPRCRACMQDCRMVSQEKMLRGQQCPFMLRRGSAAGAGWPRPPRAVGVDSFEWRGRLRRDVPGG